MEGPSTVAVRPYDLPAIVDLEGLGLDGAGVMRRVGNWTTATVSKLGCLT